MVDAYATSLGGLTLAVNNEHFLLEESLSNGILELRPAILPADRNKPVLFRHIESFSTGSDHMEVTWQQEQDIVAVTTLRLLKPNHLQLDTHIKNIGATAANISAVLPISIPAEGPGACALAMHELNTLGSGRLGKPLQYVRVHGQEIFSSGLTALFASGGSPCLLIAVLKADDDLPLSRLNGARGKVISLDISNSIPGETIEAGGVFHSSSFLLTFGNFNIYDELQEWQAKVGDLADRIAIPEFNASESAPELVVEEEIPEEPAEPEIPEASESEAAAEKVEEIIVAEEPEVQESQEEEPNQNPVEEEETVAPATGEAAVTATEEEGAEDLDALFDESVRPMGLSRRRCAAYRRALRVSEGVWPRWAMGRRYAPLEVGTSRTRHNWRWSKPQLHEAE